MDVWGNEGSPLTKWSSDFVDVWDLWEKMVARLSQQQLEISAIILKKLWRRRNCVIFQDKFVSPTQVIQMSTPQLADFQMAQQSDVLTEEGPVNTRSRTLKNWQPPVEDGLKGNWDATLDSATKITGFGFVVRDSFGEVQLSSSRTQISNYIIHR